MRKFNLSNIVIMTDSYKVSHWLQYPNGAQNISSYIESRGGEYDETLFFGLQMFIKQYLLKPVTHEDIDEAKEFFLAHFGKDIFNEKGWRSIVDDLGGMLPVRIRAVKEGTILPTKNVLVQIDSTKSDYVWLISYLETALLRAVWYPTTVATRSKKIKNLILEYLNKTSDNVEAAIGFALHDFGMRGVSSQESAMIGGAAHIINFNGSDTTAGIIGANNFYDAGVCAYSVPAAEHSTITSWGKEGELDAYENMLDKFATPGGIVAVVSDSYDIYNAVEFLWGEDLKEKVINSGARVVIRPDSGVPHIVAPEIVHLLSEKFGYTVNSKGFKVLPDCVRVIQGDGINEHSIELILRELVRLGFSTENIAFGMGGELLQTPNRDTLKFAMKASSILINGVWFDVFKDPVTDKGKVSKKGRLKLIKNNGRFETVRVYEPGENLLDIVYENGLLLRDQTFDEVKELANS